VSRHFLTIEELSNLDLRTIYTLALADVAWPPYHEEGVALLFERPSLRTRSASIAAVHQLGGYCAMFGADEIGLDVRESAEDVARTLVQSFSTAACRVKNHEAFARMRSATDESLRLVNLLSDQAHPTQAVADVLTLAEYFCRGDVAQLRGLRVAYVGDATNVTRSLAVALLRLGVDVSVGAPDGYQLTPTTIESPLHDFGADAGTLSLFDSANEAVQDADAVYTDAWVSMGFEEETAKRRADLSSFRVDEALMKSAGKGAVLLHCLPAHRGDEITDDVLDSESSLVWRQVFHRRTAMLGVLRWLKGEEL
jgi:ornithine carbamoyltransferase